MVHTETSEWRWLWQEVTPFVRYQAVSLLCILSGSFVSLAHPLIMKSLRDDLRPGSDLVQRLAITTVLTVVTMVWLDWRLTCLVLPLLPLFVIVRERFRPLLRGSADTAYALSDQQRRGKSTRRDNLLHAQPTATRADLDRVSRLACLTDVLDRLPAGRDTELGPMGAGLSGGERQRVASARALLQTGHSSFSTKRRRRLTCSRSGNCWRASSGGAVNASW